MNKYKQTEDNGMKNMKQMLLYRNIGITLLLMLSMIVAPVFLQTAQTDVQAQESQESLPFSKVDSLALVALYYAMSGPSWTNQGGWLQEGVPVPLWDYITHTREVNDSLYVRRMRFDDWIMTEPGYLPPEIGNMKYIERFRIRRSLVTGQIPIEISNWTDLFQFEIAHGMLTGEIQWEAFYPTGVARYYVDNNFLTGSIPEDVDNLESMVFLQIRNNRLKGSLPASIANMEHLERLNVDRNLFTGPIPDLSQLTQLSLLNLRNNPFEEGPIPDWIAQSQSDNLRTLNFAATNRTGEIPSFIADIPSLRSLSVGDGDQIGGDLANIPNLEFLPNMSTLVIREGNFHGEIPDWIGRSTISELEISNNPVTGTIPDNLTGISRLYLSGTLLTGGLPEALSQMTNLEILSIENNPNLEIGDIPSWFGEFSNLRSLNLNGSGVTGTIPNELDLPDLTSLRLADNAIEGEVPQWLKTKDLLTLDLSRTNLDIPEFPDWLANWTDIRSLSLGGLGMTGTLPNWFANHFLLETIALDDNQLTGSIPSSIGDLIYLDSLNLSNNLLEGNIPANLANAGRVTNETSFLQSVSLAGNPDLTGMLPEGFQRTNLMRVFEYENTGLCAPDESFQNWVETEVPLNGDFYFPVLYTNVSYNLSGCDHLVTSAYPEDHAYAFRLLSNYPNPFNPATKIGFEIPEDLHVTLSIYNVLGQHVSTLVNETRNAGSYEVTFDASRLASGSYIYRLEAGDRVQTRTMMLIK